jgi:hypothetical protein
LRAVYFHPKVWHLGARNNKEYLFFDFKSDAVVTPVHADALGKRIGRKLKSLTGKAPRTQAAGREL